MYDSAGINQKICFQLGTQYVYEQQLIDSDQILVMENKHKKEIQRVFGDQFNSKISVLHIKDVYKYGATTLKEILQLKLTAYL